MMVFLSKFNFLFSIFIVFGFSLISMESYSLADGEKVPFDHKLIKILNMQKGVFIEVGANDGIEQSNTLLLEKYYGWKGILIEPSNNVYKKLCSNRPFSKCFNCALGSCEENNTYVCGDFDGTMMASVNGNRHKENPVYNVLMRNLQSILDEEKIQHINFFSLDTEGYEYNILRGIDFNKTVFDYLLIEINTKDYSRICAFLSDKGYDMIENFSHYNKMNSPDWDGTHNDFLFKRRSL